MLEKTLESLLDCKEIKPVNLKGIQPCIFTRRTDAEPEAPILWPPDVKSWIIVKDPDVGKDWGQDEKWVTEDSMLGWHHWHIGHEFEQTPGDSEGQGSLSCCRPWGQRVRHDWATERQQRPGAEVWLWRGSRREFGGVQFCFLIVVVVAQFSAFVKTHKIVPQL